LIIICAKHAQSPIDVTKKVAIGNGQPATLIVLKVNTGVIFTGGSKLAEHGGLNEDDIHGALLVSFAGLAPNIVKTSVLNQQVAPTIIKILGFDPNQLQAVQKEQINVLPFLLSN